MILATKPFARDNPATSWWHVLSTSALLAASLVATTAPIPLVGRIAFSVLTGLLLLRLFVIYHDQQHRAILDGSRLADWLMRGFGILALSPSSIWCSSHNYHHNHNSKLRSAHIGSFPVMTKSRFLKSSRLDRIKYLFTRHPLTLLGGYFFIFLYGMCLAPLLSQPRKHYDCGIALVVHGVIGFLWLRYFGWQGLLLGQTLPHLVTYAIGSYLFYVQHNFPKVSFGDTAGWTYEKAALESSSYLKTGKVAAWFTANIGYHHIHHLNAKIPFYRLPEALKAIPELQSPRTTSLRPSEIVRCLRLKVWDSDAQQMVSLRQLRAEAARNPSAATS